jgi:hypothetical protein
MEMLKEKLCRLCGPPFEEFPSILGMWICSFACGKRYVQEVLAKPHGLKVKHGKSIEIKGPNGTTQGIIFVYLPDITQDTGCSVYTARKPGQRSPSTKQTYVLKRGGMAVQSGNNVHFDLISIIPQASELYISPKQSMFILTPFVLQHWKMQ